MMIGCLLLTIFVSLSCCVHTLEHIQYPMTDLKQKLKKAASALLQNAQSLLPKFTFDWEVLTDSLEGYIDARFTLIKIELRELLSQMAEKMAIGLVIILLGGIALMLFSIGLSLMLNHFTDSQYAGFLIVAFMYTLGAAAVGYYAKQKFFPDNEDTKDKKYKEKQSNGTQSSVNMATATGAAVVASSDIDNPDWHDKWDLMPEQPEPSHEQSISSPDHGHADQTQGHIDNTTHHTDDSHHH